VSACAEQAGHAAAAAAVARNLRRCKFASRVSRLALKDVAENQLGTPNLATPGEP
jgi:hypothetical protein